ncbi:MAG: hypothetical protein R3F30_16375, partial [Planctomycetota bacterium]
MLWAQSEGLLRSRGNFLWPQGLERARVRFRGDDCPVTETELIAPEELREAVLTVLGLEVGLPPEHLVESVRRWLGFRRSGRRIQVAIERALDELLEEGRARLDDGFLKTVEGP